MTVGEAPGETEDRRGMPWRGKAGRTLKQALGRLGIDLDADCVSGNAAACRPPGNREPTPHEIACCRRVTVMPAITQYHPRVVLLLGGSAVESVVGAVYPDAANDAPIGRWRGWTIPVPEWGCWVCPTFHPSYINREEGRPEIRVIWEHDIARAVGLLNAPVPPAEDMRSMVTILRTDDEVVAALARVRGRQRPVAFDYETSGLRPQVQQLVCASFCQSPRRGYAFMMRDSVRRAWTEFLEDDDVPKMAHNLKFEDAWSYYHFGVERIRWLWDSMQAAHVLDNRPGINGLKLQLFLRFGVRPYDAVISPFLESTDRKDPRAPNRIWEFIERYGEDEAMTYCGIDSIGNYRLAMRQREELGA
jgi:uracil-DNA glycosylase family 4